MPEKSLSDMPPAVKAQFEKGKLSVQRGNWDYAIEIFIQILQSQPGFFDCRQALRDAEVKKFGTSSNMFMKMLGTAGSSPQLAKGQMVLSKNPAEAMHLAEQVLKGDPTNGSGLRLLADAALAGGFQRTAVAALEMIRKNSPKDKAVGMQLANLYPAIGLPEKGEIVFSELKRAYPTDIAVDMAYKDFSARRTLKEKGYDNLADGGGSYRDILKNESEAVSLEQETRQVKSGDVAERLIREHEERLAKEPNNYRLIRTIAALYAEKKEFEKAQALYQRILDVEGAADASLEKEVADMVVKSYDHAIAQLDPDAPDHAERLAELQATKEEYVISDCKRRAENYPTDLQIRYELGLLYFKAGKISEAIQEFQKSQNNQNRRIQSLGYLGQCFARRGMHEMAIRKILEALKEKTTFDDEKKELIYTHGTVLEKMGKMDEAIKQFELIYEVDIGYKDVAAKVDSHYSGKA